jgi:hypothetical protein
MKTPDGAVAWRYRDMAMAERDQWHYLDMPPLLSDFDEVEALIPAASLDALRGELEEMRGLYHTAVGRMESAESKLAAVGAERDVLRAFANDVMEEWWEGDLDGGSRQDIAERHGLIAPQEVTEPCSYTCVCAEVDAFPLMCFRRTELLTGTLIAEAGTGEGS